jgi:tetratricopeptide (TPR) repeat protein
LGDWGELGEKERVLSAALDQLQAKPNKDYAYRVRLERGYLYSKEERYEEAANDFERATRLSPDQSTAYFFYGTALRKLSRLAAALTALQRAAALDPESKEVHEELGDVLLARSEYDRAERAYITALQLARETADKSAETRAHLGLGQVYRHLKRWLDAERELRNAINLAGEDDAETVATAEFELGLVQLKKGDKDAAILQFANSAVLFEVYGDARASANAYHYLAQTQIEEKQYDEALESLQNAQQRLNSVFVPGDTEDQELQEKIQREMTQLISLNGQEPPAANGGGG